MLSGVCTSQDSAMIRKVIQSACGSAGSPSTDTQFASPFGTISPRPSQLVKLSASTPTSGTRPNAVKIASAGTTSQPSERWAPETAVLMTGSRLGCRVHVRRELVRGDRQVEQLLDVGEQDVRGGRGQRLIPRLREDRRLRAHVVDELQELLVAAAGELL